MNLDDAIGTIISRGFTERQALSCSSRVTPASASCASIRVRRRGLRPHHAEVLHQTRAPRMGLDL